MPDKTGATALAGKDVLIIDGVVISAIGDQDAIKVDFGGPIAQMKVSKDGNAIYAMQFSGIVAKVTLRVIRGSFDDVQLNSKLQGWLSDPAGFELMNASFVKRIGDGKGNITSEVYQMSGGIFEKIPGGKMNTEGDVDQSITEYDMLFRNNGRLMQ